MANVKTAVSLQKSLFDQAEALADELKISRSRLFSLALEDFLRRSHNRQLLEKLNAAHENVTDAKEQPLRHRMRRQHRRLWRANGWAQRHNSAEKDGCGES